MIQVTYTPADFLARLRDVSAAVGSGLPQPLRRPLALLFQADVRQQFNSGVGAGGIAFRPLARNRPDGSNKPLRDKGLLAASYKAEADITGVTVASAHPGAALHQMGGVIRPVRAKVLTIPVTTEARRYGSPRRFPRPLFPIRGGRGLYERKTVGRGKNRQEQLVMHYLFADSVTIPARPVGFSDRVLEDAAELVTSYHLKRIAGNG